ncbi:hypothetical protein LCGC14_1981270 [marine sediment metagenome]|uniref:Uncharacterized protein n=1 Tax=marine sediment metagenome TaxID=412755 RepID=A0A0F9FX43_9ZZZZ
MEIGAIVGIISVCLVIWVALYNTNIGDCKYNRRAKRDFQKQKRKETVSYSTKYFDDMRYVHWTQDKLGWCWTNTGDTNMVLDSTW